jgi:hypothetical protein
MVVRRLANKLSRVGLGLLVRDSYRRADNLYYLYEYTINELYIVASILMIKLTYKR